MTVTTSGNRSRSLVLAALQHLTDASHQQLSDVTGLATSTVVAIVRELVREGVVHEVTRAADARPGRGRPPRVVALSDPPGYVVGVDVGHTRITLGVATLTEQILGERSVPLGPDRTAEAILVDVVRLVDELFVETGLARQELRGMVLSVPAPIDPRTGTVHDAVIIVDTWRGRNPAEELGALVDVPVQAVNDANASALAEHRHGAATDVDDLVFVRGTFGVGAGLVLGGRLHTGHDGGAGEIGHIRLPWTNEPCVCGQRGCLESEVSIRAIARKLTTIGIANEESTIEDVIAGNTDDSVVVRILKECGRGLGSVLADVCNTVAPAAVVIGGELAAGGEPLRAGVIEALQRFALTTVSERVSVRTTALGTRAGMVGALCVAADAAREATTGALPAAAAALLRARAATA